MLSTGKIALGATTVPTGYSLSLNFNSIRVGANGTKPTLSYDLTPSDPRIWSSSDEIVLYNTNTGVYNDLELRTINEHSDADSKTDVATLTDALNTVLKLRGVSYSWKAKLKADESRSIGFIAQEVEEVIPEAVQTDDSIGGKLLAYDMVIPYLVEAVKDLSALVESQQAQLDELKSTSTDGTKSTTSISTSTSDAAILYANSPNPFSQSTTLSYYIPESSASAGIYIYNLQGTQVKSIPIHQFGKGNCTLYGSELNAGIYLYTLIVDNKEIDTKRMILTQ